MAYLAICLNFAVVVVLTILLNSVSGTCLPGFIKENCGKKSIALGLNNPSGQQSILLPSSTYDSNHGPNHAFDGHLNTEFATKNEQDPFLWINLSSVHSLHTMTLYTRLTKQSPGYVLTNFTIEVDTSGQFSSPGLCYHYTGTKHFEIHNIMCNQPLQGQYVRIQVKGQLSLIIRELEIFGVGMCSPGFSGENCKKENIAFGLKQGLLHSSSIFGHGNSPNLAFDGNFSPEFATMDEQNPFLWINLGSVHSLHTMTLYTRLNSISPTYVLTNFTIEVDSTGQFYEPKLCYNYTGTKHLEVHNITCILPRRGKYIKIQVQAKQSLIIRELEIYECVNGYYGAACDKCGKCRNSESCDKITGTCSKGCDLGIKGHLCKAECNAGMYGYNCNETCGNCMANTACNKKNGTCSEGCKPGFTERLCKVCNDGFYGENCQKCGLCRDDATCNKTNGQCPNGCDPGRQGSLCLKECDKMYGYDCANPCGNCLNNMVCDTRNGTCPNGCNPRFKGDHCTECAKNRFGDDCQSECHCAGDDICNITSGICPEGCTTGFEGETCQKQIQTEPNGAVVGGAVGGVVVCLVLVAVIVGVVFYKRRKNSNSVRKDRGTVESAYFPDRIEQKNTDPTVCDVVELYEETVYANADVVPKPATTISIRMFVDYLSEKMAPEIPFDDEFNKLPQEHTKSTEEASKKHNHVKCRYKKLVPYDETRVVLDRIDDDETTDFINASYINGYSKKREYIAAQGTTDFNIVDFWRMIWQEQVGKIVMLTKLTESGRKKVLQYWPDEGSQAFGNISVETIDVQKHMEFCIRTFRVKKGSRVRDIQQFQFLGWPDHDVPQDTPGLIEFRTMVNSVTSKLSGPLVIHCSAGVGRTGTYITFDYIMDLLEHETELDIFQTVVNLRNQRPSMVQTREQYVFIHRVIRDAYLCQLSNVYGDELSSMDLKSSAVQQRIKLEFENLCRMCHVDEAKDDPWSRGGMNRVWFSSGGTNYIETTRHPIDRRNFDMLSTKVPDNNEILNFWRMVNGFENPCLLLLESGLNCVSFLPNAEALLDFGPVQVSHLREENITDFLKLSIFLMTMAGTRLEISVFCFTGWSGGTGVIPSTSQIIDVKNQISYWERESSRGTIVLVCRDGIERCGLYSISDYLIDSLKADEKQNVLLAAKRFRRCYPSSLRRMEQYRFCYEVIQAHLDSQSTYANLGFDD